jgi:Effector-associated domain 2
MLEAAFVAWLVAFLGDRSVRGLTRVLLGNPERRRFVSALNEAMHVTIVSIMQDMPSGSREALEPALRDCFARPPVSVLDGRTRVRTALIAAVRDQIAPLAEPRAAGSVRSVLDEVDVDADWLRDELASIAIRSIEQVGAGFPALAPLVAQLNADGLMEIEGTISAKVDGVLATIELWKQSAPSADPPRLPGPPGFSPDVTDRIADALLEIPSMSDNDARSVILSMLPVQLRGSIRYSPAPRTQVYNIVYACSYREAGLQQLVRAIRSIERDSIPMIRLDDLILEIGEGDSSAQRNGASGG